MDVEERQFRTLFLEARREEEQFAPAFDQVWQAARARRGTAPGAWCQAGAIAAILAIGLLSGLLLHQQSMTGTLVNPAGWDKAMNITRQIDLPWQSIVLVSQWQSPTDFLLKVSDEPSGNPAASTSELLELPGQATSPVKPN